MLRWYISQVATFNTHCRDFSIMLWVILIVTHTSTRGGSYFREGNLWREYEETSIFRLIWRMIRDDVWSVRDCLRWRRQNDLSLFIGILSALPGEQQVSPQYASHHAGSYFRVSFISVSWIHCGHFLEGCQYCFTYMLIVIITMAMLCY